jgi:hypothetical protein
MEDSGWLLSFSIFLQPEIRNQPSGTYVWWGYGLYPERIGDFVPKRMADCTGAEILEEVVRQLRFDKHLGSIMTSSICIPCDMPYVNNIWMPRRRGDRPPVVPDGATNLGLIGQYVEIERGVTFAIEYSARTAWEAIRILLKRGPAPPANLQALLSRRSGKPFYAVLLFRLDDAGGGRRFLRGLLPRIVSGVTAEVAGAPMLNVFVSWRAISALFTGHSRLDPALGRRQFEVFFTDPTQAPDSLAMASQLGFTGPSAPAHWWAGFRTEDIDLAVYAGCDSEQHRQAFSPTCALPPLRRACPSSRCRVSLSKRPPATCRREAGSISVTETASRRRISTGRTSAGPAP